MFASCCHGSQRSSISPFLRRVAVLEDPKVLARSPSVVVQLGCDGTFHVSPSPRLIKLLALSNSQAAAVRLGQKIHRTHILSFMVTLTITASIAHTHTRFRLCPNLNDNRAVNGCGCARIDCARRLQNAQ